MSDDWARNYVERYMKEQQEKQRKDEEGRARRQIALMGAPEKFHQIRERIAQDLLTLKVAPPFQFIEIDKSSDGRLVVTHKGTPWGELVAELKETTISCVYTLSAGASPKREPKTLRICSDIDGRIMVAENGKGKTLTYDSEVSEFLLAPIVEHIISQ